MRNRKKHNSKKNASKDGVSTESGEGKKTYYTTYGASAHYKLFIPHRYSYDYRQLTVTLRAILRCVSNPCAANAAEAATETDYDHDDDDQKRTREKNWIEQNNDGVVKRERAAFHAMYFSYNL